MSAWETVVLERFAWSRSEVSAAEGLHMPIFHFWEKDLRIQFVPSGFYPTPDLVPGQTRTIETNETDAEKQCSANIRYTMTYTLRWYPYL